MSQSWKNDPAYSDEFTAKNPSISVAEPTESDRKILYSLECLLAKDSSNKELKVCIEIMKEFFISIRQGKRIEWLSDNGKIALRKFREAGIIGEAKLCGAELSRAISQVFPDSVVLDDKTCENSRPEFGGTDWDAKREDIRERASQMESSNE